MKALRKQSCPTCGQPHWFRHWVGQFCAKSSEGLNVTDFDLLAHRFKNCHDPLGSRRVEHLMVIEVKVADVNVVNTQGKTKRFGQRFGRRQDFKKAYVRLAPGQSIDLSGTEA